MTPVWFQSSDAGGEVVEFLSIEEADRAYRWAASMARGDSSKANALAFDGPACAGKPVARWERDGRRVRRTL